MIKLIGLKLPEIKPGDPLVDIIIERAREENVDIDDGDVIVITSKILSKSLGYLIELDKITPSREAIKLSRKTSLDPKIIELIFRESDDILLAIPYKKLVDKGLIRLNTISSDIDKAKEALNMYPYMFITIRDGMLWSDSGIDLSNHPKDICSIPPRNLDDIAKKIHYEIKGKLGKYVAVVITDTEIFLHGSLDFARGSYGILPVTRSFGELDAYGKPKFGGVDILVHEFAAASALLMKQAAEGIPVVIVKGLTYERYDGGLRDYIVEFDMLREILKEIIIESIKILGMRRIIILRRREFFG